MEVHAERRMLRYVAGPEVFDAIEEAFGLIIGKQRDAVPALRELPGDVVGRCFRTTERLGLDRIAIKGQAATMDGN